MPPWPSAFPYLYHFSIIVNHHTKNAYLTTRRKHIIHTSESMSHCLITVQKGKFLYKPNVFCLLNLNHWFKITQLNIKVLLFQNAAHALHLNWVSINLIIMIKLSIDTTAQNAMEWLRYSWSIVLWKILNNIMKVKQLRTEYVQVWSVSRCLLLGEKKIPQILNHCFPTVNVFLEGDRAGSSVQWAQNS